MPVSGEEPEDDAAESGPVLNLLAVSVAAPADEMPKFLRERLDATPPVVTLSEFRELDAPQQEQVLAVVEKAVEHYREGARPFRARGNPAQQTAEDLQSFLDAARQ